MKLSNAVREFEHTVDWWVSFSMALLDQKGPGLFRMI
jgi:hypothetical protein